MLSYDILKDKPYAPLEELNFPLFKEFGLQVFIKREDLSHPFISGNKWRKLKYHLQDASKTKRKVLATFGGAWSNHLLATAAAGARFGFQTHGIVRGEEVSNPSLALCKIFGMNLHFVSRTDYREKEWLVEKLFGEQPDVYTIPEGGSGLLGEQGVAEIMEELQAPVQHIFTSVGTGATMRALLKGLNQC